MESEESLRGKGLEVYRLLLKTNKPLGIREIQRTLNLSSPSVAQYHLSKLEDAGLLQREKGNFVVKKIILEDCVRVSHFLVPRYLFYSAFSIAILIIELAFFRPNVLNREFFFAVAAMTIFIFIFVFETAKVWHKGSL